MSLEVATWVTAVATVVLAFGAYATTVLAIRAFKQQGKEVSDQAELLRIQSEQLAEDRKINAEQIRVLTLQAEELKQVAGDRERDAQERHRAQALQVYTWETREGAEPTEIVAHVRNTSQQPIYDVQLHWWPEPDPNDTDDEETSATLIGDLMPGTEYNEPADELGPYACSAISFRDRAGVWWQTMPNGRLKELPKPPRPYG